MLFVMIGFLKEGTDGKAAALGRELTSYLGQPLLDIRLAGMLHDAAGKRAGAMLFLEAADRAAAESFVKGSPLLEADLYAETHLFEYAVEVGTLGSRAG